MKNTLYISIASILLAGSSAFGQLTAGDVGSEFLIAATDFDSADLSNAPATIDADIGILAGTVFVDQSAFNQTDFGTFPVTFGQRSNGVGTAVATTGTSLNSVVNASNLSLAIINPPLVIDGGFGAGTADAEGKSLLFNFSTKIDQGDGTFANFDSVRFRYAQGTNESGPTAATLSWVDGSDLVFIQDLTIASGAFTEFNLDLSTVAGIQESETVSLALTFTGFPLGSGVSTAVGNNAFLMDNVQAYGTLSSVEIIPEPSTYALIAGGFAAVAFIFFRRRR